MYDLQLTVYGFKTETVDMATNNEITGDNG